MCPLSSYLSLSQVVVRVRLVDAGEDHDVQPGDLLFKLPRKFSLQEKGSFAEFVHLHQFPFSGSQSAEMVESIREIMSEVGSPYYIKRSQQLQFKEDRWSLAVELGWTERRVDTPLGPAYERETLLSQILSKKGFAFAFVEEAEEEVEEFKEPGGEVEGEAISSLGEDNIYQGSEEPPAGDPWIEAVLPSVTSFKARGTFVDSVGHIYMHLYEDRKTLRKVRNHLAQLTSLMDLDESSDESLTHLEPGQAILAVFDGDRQLHRGTFIKYTSATRAFVQFGDFGNFARVDTKDIRRDISNMRETPLLAFRAVLANVLPRSGDKWSNEALDFMYDNVLYENVKEGASHNNIKVQVLSDPSEEPLLVTIKLFTPLGLEKAEWVDLSEILIKRGEAVAANEAEVNSPDQRRIRSELNFSRSSQRTEVARNIRMIYPVSPCGRSEERLPKMNLHLNGGDLVEVKIIAQLRWDIVSVHLINPETNEINQKVYSLLDEEGSTFPLAENPRFGFLSVLTIPNLALSFLFKDWYVGGLHQGRLRLGSRQSGPG